MVITTVTFDQIISNQDWQVIKDGLDTMMIANPPKNMDCAFFGFIDGDNHSPIYKFKPNSRIIIHGGQLTFNTNDIIE